VSKAFAKEKTPNRKVQFLKSFPEEWKEKLCQKPGERERERERERESEKKPRKI